MEVFFTLEKKCFFNFLGTFIFKYKWSTRCYTDAKLGFIHPKGKHIYRTLPESLRPSSGLSLDLDSTLFKSQSWLRLSLHRSWPGLCLGWAGLDFNTGAFTTSCVAEQSLSWSCSFFGDGCANVSIITHASAPLSNWKCCLTYFQSCSQSSALPSNRTQN